MCNNRGGILDRSLGRFKPKCRTRSDKAARLGKDEFRRSASAERELTASF
jgi:hypothetical protein